MRILDYMINYIVGYANNYENNKSFLQENMMAYKNRSIADDECIRKNKKIGVDAIVHLH